MSAEQCWCLGPDGRRCHRPAFTQSYFCSEHRLGPDGRGPHPDTLWRAPRDPLPPDPPVSAPPTLPEPSAATDTAVAGSAAESAAMADPDAPFIAPCSGAPWADALRGETNAPPLDWLEAALRQAAERVMAADTEPLKQANALTRLGSLYIKSCRFKELQQANRDLSRAHKELLQTNSELRQAFQKLEQTCQGLTQANQSLAQRASGLEARLAALEIEAPAGPPPIAPEQPEALATAAVASSDAGSAAPAAEVPCDPALCASYASAADERDSSGLPRSSGASDRLVT